ncbi:MAG: mitochondrial fission ELM1 family protein [Verrucomicrobia bacterium]|nr:mitochondrial fission ELM1 family protein [Verrucomicrobiota bacterium]
MPEKTNAVIISDSRIGHQNQSIALCRWMGWHHVIIPVKFKSPAARMISVPLDRMGIRPKCLISGLVNPFEGHIDGLHVVVATGSRTYYAAKLLAHRHRVPVIALLNPGILSSGFDAIIVPDYERSIPPSSNIIKIPVNLSVPDENMIQESLDELMRRCQGNISPSWGIIIGGENKTSYLNIEDLRIHLKSIRQLAPENVKIMVTTSRRSGQEIENLVQEFAFDLVVLASQDIYNPIPAFNRVCERIFVTSDSANMISEVVTSGNASVEVLMNRQKSPENKFMRFIQNMEQGNHIHVFDGELGNMNKKNRYPVHHESHKK